VLQPYVILKPRLNLIKPAKKFNLKLMGTFPQSVLRAGPQSVLGAGPWMPPCY